MNFGDMPLGEKIMWVCWWGGILAIAVAPAFIKWVEGWPLKSLTEYLVAWLPLG